MNEISDMTSKDINILFGKLEGKEPIDCSNICEYFKFPHLRVACVLSDVYSVEKGEKCYNYKLSKERSER